MQMTKIIFVPNVSVPRAKSENNAKNGAKLHSKISLF